MEILNGFLRTFSPFIPLRALGTIGPKYFHLEGGKLFWVRLLIGSGRVSPWTGIWPTYGTESRETLRDTGFDCYPVRGIRQLWARDAGLGKIFGIAMIKVRDARFLWKRIGNAGSGGPFGTLFYFPFACCSFISYAFSYSSRPSPGQKLSNSHRFCPSKVGGGNSSVRFTIQVFGSAAINASPVVARTWQLTPIATWDWQMSIIIRCLETEFWMEFQTVP